MARGKKRYIYDFDVVLDIEIVVETVDLPPEINDAQKGKPPDYSHVCYSYVPKAATTNKYINMLRYQRHHLQELLYV